MQKTLIIGGGIAGLTAAYYLQQARRPFLVVEADSSLGGRVQTDEVNSYRLDRGFQVFLTAYPEAQCILDYAALDLRRFKPGACILGSDGSTARIGDPMRDISSLWPTLTSGVGSMGDKLKILSLKRKLSAQSVQDIFEQNETTTSSALTGEYGFSDDMIKRFFTPFFRGIFLEDDLSTSRRMFDFVFKMFSEGDAAIPAEGIGAISKQLASHLSPKDIRLNTSVVSIDGNKATCDDNTAVHYDQCILAVDEVNAARLLGQPVPRPYQSTVTAYYSCSDTALAQRLITLLPDSTVNNITELSSLSSGMAPSGKRLLSLTLRNVDPVISIDRQVKQALRSVLPESASYEFVKAYSIDYALPNQTSVSLGNIKHQNGIVVCGDYLHYGSLNAAMRSGRLAAETILKRL